MFTFSEIEEGRELFMELPQFTFAEIEDGQELFMELPELLGQGGVSAPELYDGCGAGRSSGKVARLKRHLYGSKDAPRAWRKKSHQVFDWLDVHGTTVRRTGTLLHAR